jgi:hypothetical protein
MPDRADFPRTRGQRQRQVQAYLVHCRVLQPAKFKGLRSFPRAQ